MDCSLPGSSVHRILQAENRMGYHFLLQGIFLTQESTQISCIADRFFTNWAMREAPEVPKFDYRPLVVGCCCSVAKLCPTLCDPMDCSRALFPFLHHLPELAQTHVHWVNDAIQLSHPPSPPSPALNLPHHQWVSSSYQMAKVLELQLQHQFF